MGNGRVGADDQVEVLHDRRGVHEVLQAVAQIQNGEPSRQSLQMIGAEPLLQAHQPHSLQPRQRLESLQRNGTPAIAFVLWIALPDNADLDAVQGLQFLTPVFDQVRFGPQVGGLRRDRLEPRSQQARQA